MAELQTKNEVKTSTFLEKMKNIGPAAVIAAAFVGPGTITTASVAGIKFGYALLWPFLLSAIMGMILLEKCARIGIIGKTTLAEAIREYFSNNPALKLFIIVLTIGAIFIGNSAFVIGNVLGAALGAQVFIPLPTSVLSVIIGVIAILILMVGSYKLVEKFLITLVMIMTVSFVITAIAIKPDLVAILKGFLIPTIPAGSLPTIIGLIGTTISGYNFFLYSSASKERWSGAENLGNSRFDLFVSIPLGVLISAVVMITAAGMYGMNINLTYGATELAKQLEPVLGSAAKYIFGLGLFAASISSAVPTALATGYVVSGLLGWKVDMKDSKFKAVEVVFICVATFFAAIGKKPLAWILFAQGTNGLLLPISAIMVLIIANDKRLLGKYVPKQWENLVSGGLVAVTIYLGLRSLFSIF